MGAYTGEQVALLLSSLSADGDKHGTIDLFEKQYKGYDDSFEINMLGWVRYDVLLTGVHYSNTVYRRQWQGLRLQQLTGRWWYFKRRAALAQLEFPKAEFRFVISKTASSEERSRFLAKKCRDKLAAAKATLSKVNMAIEKYKSEWLSLFSIEDDETYMKLIEKKKQTEQSIIEIQAEMQKLDDTR